MKDSHLQPLEGSGDNDDPYLIGNAGQLYAYVKKATTLNDSHGKLTADIVINQDLLKPDGTLNGDPSQFRAWVPIGTKDKPFYCSFDGDGHTISGLYVDSTGDNVGLFGYVDGSTDYIQNVGVKDSYIAGNKYVGSIIGCCNTGRIRNCYSEDSVIRGYKYVGGIAGDTYDRLLNCYNTSTVTGEQCVYGITWNTSYEITNCLNIGKVIGEREVYAVADSYRIENCYYLDTCGAQGYGGGLDFPVTAQQLISGEVALLLGSAYGQNLDNGQPKQDRPVLGGAAVYGVVGCDGNTASIFSNSPSQTGKHSGAYGANGICPRCGEYEAPRLEGNYYQIATAGNLFWYAQQVGEGSLSINGKLTADIDLENRPWTPIGGTGADGSKSFKGIFDGNGKTIRGLYSTSIGRGNGFIGEVRGGTVKNFTIHGQVILNNTGHAYTGGVIGSATGSAIVSGITSYVNVKLVENAHGSNWVGGMIGYVNQQALVENCVWYGTLDLDIYRPQDGVGGLIGKANAQYVGTIRNCAAYGTIRSAYQSGTYKEFDTIFVGGILSYSVSEAQTILENCIWGGTIINETNLGAKANISAVGTLSGFKNISGCYVVDNAPYITTNKSQDDKFSVITREQLQNGHLAYVLSETESGSHWGQTLDGTGLPIPGGQKVYYGYALCTDAGKSFSNDSRVGDAKNVHAQEISYRDKGDGTHIPYYNCCKRAQQPVAHSFVQQHCVCGVFGDSCGDSSYWTEVNGVLYIYGTGEVKATQYYYYGEYLYTWDKLEDVVTTLVVAEGITSLGDEAFLGFEALSQVTLPESLVSMGEYVFSLCPSLEEIQLPGGLKEIPDYAFSGSGLMSIELPEGLERIGYAAFANCIALRTVILPSSLKRIEAMAFAWGDIPRMELPAALEFIGNEAFAGADVFLVVAEDNPLYCADENGVLFNKDKTTLLYSPVVADSYRIPETVTAIGDYAFEEGKITEIQLPEGLKSIGKYAFRYAQLKAIRIPASVEFIGEGAFNSCTYLEQAEVACNWNDEAPLYSFDGQTEVLKVVHVYSEASNLCVNCGDPTAEAVAVVSKNGVNVMGYTSLAAAFEAVSGAIAQEQAVLTVLQAPTGSFVADGVFTLDLNGFALQVDAQQLTVIDSAGNGSLVTNAVVAMDTTVNGVRYIALNREGVYTAHRLQMEITKVTLRTGQAGLYYKAFMDCDTVLQEQIKARGVALSLEKMPGEDFMTAGTYTRIEDGNVGEFTSGSVFNIFKNDLSAEENAARGEMKIYAIPYVELMDGTVLLGESGTAKSLQDVMTYLNANIGSLDIETQFQVDDFYVKWAAAMADWKLGNLE